MKYKYYRHKFSAVKVVQKCYEIDDVQICYVHPHGANTSFMRPISYPHYLLLRIIIYLLNSKRKKN